MNTKNNAQMIIDSGPVLLSMDENGVASLTLNTPETANCLNNEMLIAMTEALMLCHGDKRLRALILSGNGKNFCAGGDLKTFIAKGEDLPFYVRQATNHLQHVCTLLIHLQVPVITAVQGYAAGGGGFGFVCASDVVIAADSAKFLAGATRSGMVPDAGLSVTLQNLVGFRQAMHILLTNPVIGAEEALDLGIVTKVSSAEALAADTLSYATEIANNAPLAMGHAKRLLWNGLGAGFESVLDDESRTVAMLSGTEDCLEAMQAILDKRQPRFTGK